MSNRSYYYRNEERRTYTRRSRSRSAPRTDIVREVQKEILESLERDLNRLGRQPSDFKDDFEQLKQEIDSGKFYEKEPGSVTVQSREIPTTYASSVNITLNPPTNQTGQTNVEKAPEKEGNPVQTSPPGNTQAETSANQKEPSVSGLSTIPIEIPLCQTSATESLSTEHTTKTESNSQQTERNGLTRPSFTSEYFIPIRRLRDTFDDFHMKRWSDWFDDCSARIDDTLERSRREWEHRLGEIKSRCHSFIDTPAFEPTQTLSGPLVSMNPSGKPEFAVQFDVKHFKPEEISISVKAGKLIVTANHEEKTEHVSSLRKLKRILDLPENVQLGMMKSVISKDGILSITSPIKTDAIVASESGTAIGSIDHHNTLSYCLPINGYRPEEVTVTIHGRKVKVHAAHDESSSIRKVHNEFAKTFDLPPEVDPEQVRSYIKDGDTLYIEAQLRDGMQGKIHIIPVGHKKQDESKTVKETQEKK